MNLQSKFGKCITTQSLIIALLLKQGGITDRRMDDSFTRCPRQTFQAGGIKTKVKLAKYVTLPTRRLKTLKGVKKVWIKLKAFKFFKASMLLGLEFIP